ncbi:MAG TPA: hypothetical protein DHV63_13745, partial [Pseudomonas sp.]|nr:hypothetical protein [Pseudomonas sp.]
MPAGVTAATLGSVRLRSALDRLNRWYFRWRLKRGWAWLALTVILPIDHFLTWLAIVQGMLAAFLRQRRA